MELFIISIICFFISFGLTYYIKKRNIWIKSVLTLHCRLVKFTMIVLQIIYKKKLKYETEDLYMNTMDSVIKMFLFFWKRRYYSVIKDRDKFNYLIDTVSKYPIEFEAYWQIFIMNNIEINVDTINKFKSIVKNNSFKKVFYQDSVEKEGVILH